MQCERKQSSSHEHYLAQIKTSHLRIQIAACPFSALKIDPKTKLIQFIILSILSRIYHHIYWNWGLLIILRDTSS